MRALLIGLVGLWHVPARAQDVLDIPSSCGSASELTREIDALRASSAASYAERPEVRLAPQGDAYVLQIALPDGTRTLRDPDCRALFRAAIVIAALGHERSADALLETTPAPAELAPTAPASAVAVLAAPPTPVADPAVQRPQSQQTTREKAPVRAAAPRPRPAAHAHAFGQVEAAYGAVPAWSAALAAGASFGRGLWAARAWFGYLTPRTHEQADQAVRIQALQLAASFELVPLKWLRIGLGVDLFLLRGQGVGVPSASVDWTAQPAPHLALRASVWTRGKFSLQLTGRALWSPQPSRFRLSDGSELYATEHFAFQLGVAAAVQFL